MLPVPLARLGVGVNTAVRVRPVPLMALKEPPVTDKSPALPSHAKLASGASENVKLMLAVSPALRGGYIGRDDDAWRGRVHQIGRIAGHRRGCDGRCIA